MHIIISTQKYEQFDWLKKRSHCISSNKRSQRLLNFETVRCDANYREVLIPKLVEMNNIKNEK